jgi:hypothetical protein
MPYEKDPNELGALWTKSGAKGDYMTGDITVNGETIKVVCFRAQKRGEKSPDWRVLKSVPREQAQGARPAPGPASDVDDSSIPF